MAAKARSAARRKVVAHPAPGEGRAGILRAATGEFAALGFSGASTAGIARRAGVTQPLVHHHFGSKQALWNEVVTTLFEDLRVRLGEAQSGLGKSSRADRLESLVRTFVRFCGERPELSRLLRTESSAGGPSFEFLFERYLQPLVRFVEDEVNGAIEDGSFRKVDARLVYFVLVGGATSAFAEPKLAQRAFGLDVTTPETIEQQSQLLVDVLLRGLLKRPS